MNPYEISIVPVNPNHDSIVWDFLPKIILQYEELQITVVRYTHNDIMDNLTVELSEDKKSLFVGGVITLNKHDIGAVIKTINYVFVYFKTTDKPIILGDCINKIANQIVFKPHIYESVYSMDPLRSEVPYQYSKFM